MKIEFKNGHIIETDYEVGDRVEFEIAEGTIIAIVIEGNNIMYKVGYFMNDDYFQIILYPNQFKIVKVKKSVLGFSNK